MIRILSLILLLEVPFFPGPVLAQTAPLTPEATDPASTEQADFDRLVTALDLTEVVAIMREEGISYGATLEADLFPGKGGADWMARVDAIYDPDRMLTAFVDRLRADLGADQMPALLAFFGSERGLRITALELSARRALLDQSVEDAANQMRDDMAAAQDPRLAALRRFAEVNDLIESNVSGAMNANYAFYRGLADGGAFGSTLSEDQIVTDVWSQEEATRLETVDWLFAYLGMAYKPLSDADVAAYIAFSETREGQALNRALFAGFDAMFTGISRDLGRAAARFMAGQEL